MIAKIVGELTLAALLPIEANALLLWQANERRFAFADDEDVFETENAFEMADFSI